MVIMNGCAGKLFVVLSDGHCTPFSLTADIINVCQTITFIKCVFLTIVYFLSSL